MENNWMDILDVYSSRRTWSEYISRQARLEEVDATLEKRAHGVVANGADAVNVSLSSDDYPVAVQSGLGALGIRIGRGAGQSEHTIKLSLEKLAGGLDRLNADFNLLLGDLIWKAEMQEQSLNDILQEIRLAEFEREARAYRSRAERAYVNGWYEEALGDFLEAEKRHYPDFAVHRSIANIYFYHLIDLPKALAYFRKAAKYAQPSDARQAAEAHYFAGIVCLLERRLDEGLEHMRGAVTLNPELYEAHYQRACLAALRGDFELALMGLESAIQGDPRYYERAKNDPVFDPMRTEVQRLLDHLMKLVQDRLAEVQQAAKLPDGCVIVEPEEERLSTLFHDLERRVAEAKTYKDSLEFLEALSEVQQQLKDIAYRFHRQYQISLNDYIRSEAFSPDGQWLATGMLHGGLKVWDVYTGLCVQTLEGHLASVNSVAFSPNSRWLASGGRDKIIKLWDAETAGEIHTFRGHEAEVRAVAFSPDGEWLVSGSHDRTVRIWRVVTGREAQILGYHTRPITSVVCSPDGRWIASGSLDRTVKLWDVAGGRTTRLLRGHAEGVESLAVSPDGKLLASGGEDRQIKLWEVDTGRELQTLTGFRNDVISLAFSPDSRLLAAGCLGQTIRVWRLDGGQLLTTVPFPDISYNSVAFSPDGQWLALGGRDLQLWLKVILTKEEYAAVKAGEARARLSQTEEEEDTLFISGWRS
jgi:hypothetical protein